MKTIRINLNSEDRIIGNTMKSSEDLFCDLYRSHKPETQYIKDELLGRGYKESDLMQDNVKKIATLSQDCLGLFNDWKYTDNEESYKLFVDYDKELKKLLYLEV